MVSSVFWIESDTLCKSFRCDGDDEDDATVAFLLQTDALRSNKKKYLLYLQEILY